MSDTDLLDDIFDTVDALDDEPNIDVAANSCDEDDLDLSDLDVPAPVAAGPSSSAASTSSRSNPFISHSPALRTGSARSPLLPSASTNRAPNAVATPCPGGRVIYTTQKAAASSANTHCYVVQYRKPQNRKHKTWDGDAYIKIQGSSVTMVSEDGKQMATTALVTGLPGEGTELRIGNWDCEVDHEVSFDAFKKATSCLNNPANAPILQHSPAAPTRTPVQSRTLLSSRTPVSSFAKPFKTPTVVSQPRSLGMAARAAPTPAKVEDETTTSSTAPAAALSFYAKPKQAPKRIVIGEKSSKEREAWGGALHNPKADGAVVMPRPPDNHPKRLSGTPINDVVIDPILTSKMREHQKKGVEFMYRSVMGYAESNGHGCILADEMGLGKTLQTIALIYTLCKQSPWQNESSTIGRALVVCPVSLVNNWKKEFRKWLPRDFGVTVVDDANESKVSAFTHHRGLQVLIIGYERLRKVIKKLAGCQPPIGLIVCDEGHRLKSKDNKTTKMFEALSTPRRIMLTGTPVQNDLGEFWAMADFCNRGVFGTYSQFSREFEKPITKSREPRCSDADAERGKECMSALYTLAQEFVLRRTAEVLDKYLPPKTEYVVFVAPTKLQLDIFAQILGGAKGPAILRGMSSAQLATIDLLRKVSNSPLLLRNKDDDGFKEITSVIKEATSLLGPSNRSANVELSGKMIVLDRILKSLAMARDEKIVVVSNWTSTLNIVQDLCLARRYNFLRLDGSTPQKQRQELVDRFNTGSFSDSMVFLLSAKAGGVGLNLIGASRLVLFDSDWNPSTDLQAMARIHRDGQKRPVCIYRLLTTNTIDEKIYQRQITKTGLSDQMMGGGEGGKGTDSKDSFSYEELRDIFSVNLYTDGCQTHDLLGCDCEGKNVARDGSEETETRSPSREGSAESSDDEESLGFQPASQFKDEPTPKMRRKAEAAQQAKLASLKKWKHYDAFNTDSVRSLSDNLLYNLAREDYRKFDRTKENSDEHVAKKRKRTVLDVIGAASDEFDNSAVPDSEAEDSEGEVSLPRKRGAGRSQGKSKVVLASEDTVRKRNLLAMAEAGQGGCITYVFEKVAKAGFDV